MQKTLPSILLLAEDSDASRVLSQKLSDHGFICQLESDVDLALQDLQDKSWTVVLVDLESSFQRMTAIELAREIRKVRVSKPELALLSERPQDSIFESHQVGACAIIRKPVKIEDVLKLLEAQGFQMTDAATPSLNRRFAPETFKKRLSQLEPKPKAQPVQVKTQVSNVGRGGFYMPIPSGSKPPEIGQVVEFDVKMGMVPETRFRGHGVIRWVHNEDGQIGVGIEFLTLTEDGEMFVNAFSELFKVREFVPCS